MSSSRDSSPECRTARGQVVREGNRLGEVLVQPQRTGDVAGDGGHLHRVGEASAEVLPAAAKKHLCLVLQSAKGARMDNAVAIALKLGAPLGRFLGVVASAGVGAKLRVGASVAFAASSSAQLRASGVG